MKRALIITYYWPPAGGPGVQRWLQFVKYFNDFGIEPVVYIPENPHYPMTDNSFVYEVPKDIKILKHPIKEPYRLAGLFSKKKTNTISSGIISKKKQSLLEKVMLYIRGNFFIPDARIGWVRPSVSFLSNYLLEQPVDIIISSGPPHSLHLIAMQLQKSTGIKWMADFRDPWTTIHYHASLRLNKASERKHKQLEARVLNSANCIVVTSPTTKREFEMITETPIEVITNGYAASNVVKTQLDTSFSISHIGSLLSERNPKELWKVLAEIASEKPLFKSDLCIQLAGTVSDDVLASIEKFGLSEATKSIGYVSHSEALQLQHNSQVLLLLEIDRPETRAIIPGKLFEYLAAKRPILAMGPFESDIEDIIVETKSGKFFSAHKEEVLKAHILNLYEQYKTTGLVIESENIEKYSRRELSRHMSDLIRKLV
ncbi:glycosyltransferase [Ulvibacter antarcticus]|uniref:Glycosyl transferase family 4 n=1 Tax=Ulvibacter antarcticus TaxID=442714 RepID=A0A3L9YXH3_9FLAO|nr:glycosyltransferase [Ulvibacter antarcticus]RMA64527.1 glycosyl transferase family 4 [Ulvibacter antarcticus]